MLIERPVSHRTPERAGPAHAAVAPSDGTRADGLPTVLMARAELEVAAHGEAPSSASEDEMVAIAPQLVAWCIGAEMQDRLRALVGDGVRQIDPDAGQTCDGAFLMLGVPALVERWLDPARDDPSALLLESTTWLSKLAALLADVVPGTKEDQPQPEAVGFGCVAAGSVHKGRARLGSLEEERLIAGVRGAVVAKLAPSPAVLALTMASASEHAPPGIVRRGEERAAS